MGTLLQSTLKTKREREATTFQDAVQILEEAAGADTAQLEAVATLSQFNQDGVFNEVPFETVWSLVLATSKAVN